MAEVHVDTVIIRLNDQFDMEVRHPSGKTCAMIHVKVDATGNTVINYTKGIREVEVKEIA